MSIFTAFRRLHNDHIGILVIKTVFQSLERCSQYYNGAEGSVTVVRSQKRCPRNWIGVIESGTVPQSLRGILEVITPLQSLEWCRRLFGTVLRAKFLKKIGDCLTVLRGVVVRSSLLIKNKDPRLGILSVSLCSLW